MLSFSAIKRALLSGYEALNIGLPTAYENQLHTPLNGAHWASVFIIPASTAITTSGSSPSSEHVGLMQIDFNVPVNSGDGELLEYCDRAATFFYPGRRFSHSGATVLILNSSRSQGRHVDGWFRISVTINWKFRG